MDFSIIRNELQLKAVKSSGPGGQHVNKTATKVVIQFSVFASEGLDENEKSLIEKRLANQINAEGMLVLSCSETRSQHRNRELGILRLQELLKENLKVNKRRKKTKPSKSAVEKRLKAKKHHALKKGHRRPPKIE